MPPVWPSKDTHTHTHTHIHTHTHTQNTGVPLWYSRLRIQHCHCSSLGWYCGSGPIPCLYFLHAEGTAKKKKKKKKKKTYCYPLLVMAFIKFTKDCNIPEYQNLVKMMLLSRGHTCFRPKFSLRP